MANTRRSERTTRGLAVWADTVGHVTGKLRQAAEEDTPVIITPLEAKLLLEAMRLLVDAEAIRTRRTRRG